MSNAVKELLENAKMALEDLEHIEACAAFENKQRKILIEYLTESIKKVEEEENVV